MDCFIFSEKDLQTILDAKQNNKLVFFIGSGYSKLSETESIKIPNWSELINDLKSDLNLSDESDYLKIAQLYFLKFGQHSYVNKVKSTIKELEPSIYHKEIFELNPHYVITTNWDNILEKTVKKMGLAYDIISSDIDLAQSQLDKKIIKMHGDFMQHNFVFKEDDYLQYDKNFPLIENYIKGIFSTSTIVFLGYSYSDYNLKQIVSWITSISKATPKKYLVQKKFDYAQSAYLSNHGISLLTPNKPTESYNELYDDFFESLKIAMDPDKIISRIINSYRIINSDVIYDKSTVNRIIKNYHNKLYALSQYFVLLPEQVSKKFTNATIDYRQPISLHVHNDLLTTDYNKDRRIVNEIYFKNVIRNGGVDLKYINNILTKAFIKEIKVNKEIYYVNEKKLNIEGVIIDRLHFKSEDNSLDIAFHNNKFKEILEFFMQRVKYYLEMGNYIMATISMANYDIVYGIVERHAANESDKLYEYSKEIVSYYTPYEYKQKAQDFPKNLQQDLDDLIQILEFNEIYKAYYKFSIDNKVSNISAKIRAGGGYSNSKAESEIKNRLYCYVNFFIGNEIFIEEFNETKNLFESTVLTCLENNLIEGDLSLTVYDLFILIKYFKLNNLKIISDEIVKNNDFLKIYKHEAKTDAILKKYLIESFDNICKSFKYKDQNVFSLSPADKRFSNTLILLGFVRWNKNQFENIINNIIDVLQDRSSGVTIYENIQYFLYVNSVIYDKSHESILKVVDIILTKILDDNFNGYDQFVLEGGGLRNVYFLSTKNGFNYTNIELIKSVLSKINLRSEKWKLFIINKLLLDIKSIGSDEVIKEIDNFINANLSKLPLEKAGDYVSMLSLIAKGYPVPNNFHNKLNNFIDCNIPQNEINVDYISSMFEELVPKLLRFIIEDRNFKKFESILKKIEDKTKRD
ncbi:TPA: SIR2 family protein [Serratia marcescens]|nr:SIR2 family protein [Serratia marcescens]HEJ6931191.1 SIR2 family protein [Serratia marcescens]HEJ7074061.1 SIR2 family protein [Serratia marcescens]HEJ7197463.1 SIR2 family protein [Serratia marcescens]